MPIDPDFQKSRRKAGKEDGVIVWGPVNPPEELGIHGTNVAVDWDLCDGCGACLDVCPMHVYRWVETSHHPTSQKKALPAKEQECVQCYRCETQCSAQAIRVTFGGPPGWERVLVILMLAQIIGGVIYGTLLGPALGLQSLMIFGWIVLAVSLPFFFSPILYFPKKGRPQQGKSVMDTTVVVDTGTYGVVRHPQILGCILLMSASIFISQHWLSIIIGVPMIVWFYSDIPKDEKGLLLKFGDSYKRYMRKVPRMNFIVGLIRLLKRRRNE